MAGAPEALAGIEAGGASPEVNIGVIAGPIDALTRLAEMIDPATDGFTLTRDDEAVAAAIPQALYETDDA